VAIEGEWVASRSWVGRGVIPTRYLKFFEQLCDLVQCVAIILAVRVDLKLPPPGNSYGGL
jgi:hypothetical protein